MWAFDHDGPGRRCCSARPAEHQGSLCRSDLELMAWQRWCSINLTGFVERETGLRRFRQASIWVPRGNGKSTWVAPLALHFAFADGEGGAEAYAAAVTRDQAKIVWQTAWEMTRRCKDFRQHPRHRHLGQLHLSGNDRPRSSSRSAPTARASKGSTSTSPSSMRSAATAPAGSMT